MLVKKLSGMCWMPHCKFSRAAYAGRQLSGLVRELHKCGFSIERQDRSQSRSPQAKNRVYLVKQRTCQCLNRSWIPQGRAGRSHTFPPFMQLLKLPVLSVFLTEEA